MIGIQLHHENNYFREYIRQQGLLQQIHALHQSQPIFIPPRANINDMYCSDGHTKCNSYRGGLLNNHSTVKSDEPETSKWSNKEPTSISLPLSKMNKEFKWPNEKKLSYDEAQFKNMFGLESKNLSRDNMIQLGFLNSFTNQLNPTIEDRVRPKYDQFNLNTPVSYSLTPSLTAMTVFNAHDKQGFRDYKRY